MEKTLFAGLTVLDEDESILTDGGAFIGRDRRIIDRLLEVGAKTHRHDGSAGLSNPLQPIGASATGSAGTLPGDLTFSVGYTLEDDQLGETLISPLTVISTPPVIARPSVAPTGVADYSAGALLSDTYYYAISYTDGSGGETPIGPATSVERQPGFANGRVMLTGLDDDMAAAGATGWRLYRAVGGGNFHYLASGTGDAYIDDGSVAVQPDITPLSESENSTNSDNGLLLHLPSADGFISPASHINVYLSEDGSFSGNSFLDQFPVGSAGQDAFYPSITLENAQPPDTNNSIGGATLIDPDNELLDWHWKRPVAFPYQLGSGLLGDVRMVTQSGYMYGMLGSAGSGEGAWTRLGSGAIDPAEAWHEIEGVGEPPFENGAWHQTGYASAAFRLNRDRVEFQGAISPGSAARVFTLPPDYRPVTNRLVPVAGEAPGGPDWGYMKVGSAGAIELKMSDTVSWVGLDGQGFFLP